MPDIIGVGDTNVDVMIKVDHVPAHDEKVRGKLIGSFPGGVTANFCAAAARFGASVGAVCKVGRDSYGEISMGDLRERGVDVSHMVVDENAETYYCLVLLDDTGEKALTIVETSGFLPKREELDPEYLRTAKWVHMTTLDLGLVEYVGAALCGSGTRLSLDIEGTASSAGWEVWKQILSYVSVAFPNEAGLRALTGKESLAESAQILLDCGVETVVVTRGENGVSIFTKEGSFSHPAYHVRAVDTTGAGDCFNAVFLSCLTQGRDMKTAAAYAAAAAAISIQSVGARTALPTPEQVEQFMAERER